MKRIAFRDSASWSRFCFMVAILLHDRDSASWFSLASCSREINACLVIYEMSLPFHLVCDELSNTETNGVMPESV
ncbi:MAG: hypothetical protein IPN36_15960 [Bacteroidetes bacterium]|nr:hypothetical protein [Bacteroidota bacterium]